MSLLYRKEIENMNLPNKLTLLRIAMIPLFVVIFYIPVLKETSFSVGTLEFSLDYLLGFVVFAIAAYTDRLDGKIARRDNLITTFGKFMDPLADKLLVTSALLLGIELGLIPAFVAILIISREFMVTGIRLLAVGEGKVIAASNLGKAKTVSQMVMIIVLLLLPVERSMMFTYPDGFLVQAILADALISLATILTVVSGVDYLLKNKSIIFESK
jgi:CDP-diacylglycerol---glycerol-3-phosphate 3-phosphatidyltransferase